MLEIKNLHVKIVETGVEILTGVNLTINDGEIHVIMGPNGTGKSTLAETLMGNETYKITNGKILFNNEDLTTLPTDERAKRGLFLAMQYPAEIDGISNIEFIKAALEAQNKLSANIFDFVNELESKMKFLNITPDFSDRCLNTGFSGGEKKRNEILQMLMLKPKLAILDEIDSGLDIDALQVVATGIESMRGTNFSCLIITHYKRLLNYVKPNFIHIMLDGKIVTTGTMALANELEENGYASLHDKLHLEMNETSNPGANNGNTNLH